MTPEACAREKIDQLLSAAGWALQDRDQFDRNASLGVAVREFPLPAGPCDYLLFIDGKAAGVIEAKKSGVTLSGVADQSDKYMAGAAGAPCTLAEHSPLRLREHRRRNLLSEHARSETAVAPALCVSPTRYAARMATPARNSSCAPRACHRSSRRASRLPGRGH